jgi:hypothetical protein
MRACIRHGLRELVFVGSYGAIPYLDVAVRAFEILGERSATPRLRQRADVRDALLRPQLLLELIAVHRDLGVGQCFSAIASTWRGGHPEPRNFRILLIADQLPALGKIHAQTARVSSAAAPHV